MWNPTFGEGRRSLKIHICGVKIGFFPVEWVRCLPMLIGDLWGDFGGWRVKSSHLSWGPYSNSFNHLDVSSKRFIFTFTPGERYNRLPYSQYFRIKNRIFRHPVPGVVSPASCCPVTKSISPCLLCGAWEGIGEGSTCVTLFTSRANVTFQMSSVYKLFLF